MSQARVHTVGRAVKDQGQCEKCGDALPPGSAYRWYSVGFRSHYKHRRCMKATCTPRPSELESSLLSSVYSAQEGATDNLEGLKGDDEYEVAKITEEVEGVAEAIDEVAQQYREQDEAFGGGGATDSAERADTLEQASSDLQGWQPSGDTDPPSCSEHDELDAECDDCRSEASTWWDDLVQEAIDAIDEVALS